MKRFVDVHSGEVMAASQDTVLHSDAQNACLVICAYDKEKRIGGLAHALISNGDCERKKNHSHIRDTDHAIDEMLKDMTMLGANQKDIEVCLVTAENIPHNQDDPQYNKTLKEAIGLLNHKHIKCRENPTYDAGKMHVTFDVGTGDIKYEQY